MGILVGHFLSAILVGRSRENNCWPQFQGYNAKKLKGWNKQQQEFPTRMANANEILVPCWTTLYRPLYWNTRPRISSNMQQMPRKSNKKQNIMVLMLDSSLWPTISPRNPKTSPKQQNDHSATVFGEQFCPEIRKRRQCNRTIVLARRSTTQWSIRKTTVCYTSLINNN